MLRSSVSVLSSGVEGVFLCIIEADRRLCVGACPGVRSVHSHAVGVLLREVSHLIEEGVLVLFEIALSVWVIQWEGWEISPISADVLAHSARPFNSLSVFAFSAFGELRCVTAVSLISTIAITCGQSVESSNSPAGL